MTHIYLIIRDPTSTCTCLLLRCLLSQTLQHIQQGDYAFLIELKDTYLHIPTVQQHHHHHILHSVCQINLISGRFLPVGLAIACGDFTSLTKPVLCPCQCIWFCTVIYLDGIWFSFILSTMARGHDMFMFFICLSWNAVTFSPSLNFI